MSGWALRELVGAELGDARLDARLVRLVEHFSERPEASIPQACGSAAATKAAYRFWDNRAVSPEGILRPHRYRTLERCREWPVTLVVQDTTEIDLSSHAVAQGLGYLTCPHARGLLVHNLLCVSSTGTPLGLLEQFVWTRPLENLGQRSLRDRRVTQEKESQRWLDGLAAVERHLSHQPCVVLVGDRESDLFDLFAAPRASSIELLVRVRDRRRRVAGPIPHLGEAIRQSPPRAETTIEVPRGDDRPSRKARLTIRWARLAVERPVNHPNRLAPRSVSLWFVEACEEEPPPGVQPIGWLLATTLRVETIDEALAVLRWYTYRWRIERFHYVLKSGYGIERHRLATQMRMERLLATLSVVAWHVLYLAYEARRNPTVECTRVFTGEQWQVLHLAVHPGQRLPAQPPDLATALRDCARLGGFLARKRDGPPGVKTLWRGWSRLFDLAAGYRLAIEQTPHPDSSEDYG